MIRRAACAVRVLRLRDSYARRLPTRMHLPIANVTRYRPVLQIEWSGTHSGGRFLLRRRVLLVREVERRALYVRTCRWRLDRRTLLLYMSPERVIVRLWL